MKGNLQTVLIVEDEADVMLAATELFKSLGYRVIVASNGIEAINLISEDGVKIDVLFSDVVMPNGVSGIALGHAVSKSYPNVKVILTSGYTPPFLKEKHGDPLEFTFLKKPYNLADLIRSLG